jgi:3-hydroxyisobutyrate dehydrogenase
MRYAFIGLGELGAPLARCLIRAGLDVTVHDREPARMAGFAATADSAAGAVAGADAAITCLPSPAASAAVAGAILPALRPGAAWIEVSTLGHEAVLALSARAGAQGIGFLEAPVTGGVHLALTGAVTMLTGGDPALVAAHRAALSAMAARQVHMGPVGSAAVAKVITNMLAFIHLVADGEALMLAARAGLDLGRAWEAIRLSSGNSFVHETEGQLILNGSYDVGFTMALALKDLGFARDIAAATGTPLDLAARTLAIFEAGAARYGPGAQSTAIVQLLEEATGTPLRAPGFPARLG